MNQQGNAIGRANISRGPCGLFFATGYRLTFPIIGTFVIGNVVLTKHERSYLDTQLIRHENAVPGSTSACSGCP